jgi:hypothetical protein
MLYLVKITFYKKKIIYNNIMGFFSSIFGIGQKLFRPVMALGQKAVTGLRGIGSKIANFFRGGT